MFDQPELSPRCPGEPEDSARSVLGRPEEDMAGLRELGVTAVRLAGLIYLSILRPGSVIVVQIEAEIREL